MSGTKASGDQGEALAGRYLEARGYTILDRQWRCRFGELDIVARSPEGVLCFVEAKRRGPGSIGLPREFVDGRKQQRLRRAANLFTAWTAPPASTWRRFMRERTARSGWSTWRTPLHRFQNTTRKVRYET